jgi:hypothetical protein
MAGLRTLQSGRGWEQGVEIKSLLATWNISNVIYSSDDALVIVDSRNDALTLAIFRIAAHGFNARHYYDRLHYQLLSSYEAKRFSRQRHSPREQFYDHRSNQAI